MTLVEGPVHSDRPRAGRMKNDSARTEPELLAACRAGRRDALEELVSRHYDRIHRLAAVMAGPAAAADLTQETFLGAVKALPRFRGESAFTTWLISILRNQYLLFLRGRKKWPLAPLEAEAERLPAPEPSGAEQEAREILSRVDELPEEFRTTLVLYHVDGLKYSEIAGAMGCPVGTVRSRLFEARERLRKRVKAEA